MNDMSAPMSATSSEYGSLDGLDEKLCSCLEECHDKMTYNQLRQCRDYFQSKMDSLQSATQDGITIEDFENIKKQDIDGDSEKGEK